jgi:hypothetical protein
VGALRDRPCFPTMPPVYCVGHWSRRPVRREKNTSASRGSTSSRSAA